METQEIQLLENFDRDRDWFFDNIRNIQQENLGKFIAVNEKSIIASNEKMEEVVRILEEKGLDPSLIFIEFVYPADSTILL